MRLIGLDLIALSNLPDFNEFGLSFSASQSEDQRSNQWLQPASGIWLTHALAERLQLRSARELTHMAGGQIQTIPIAGQLGDATSDLPDDLIIADILTVQSF